MPRWPHRDVVASEPVVFNTREKRFLAAYYDANSVTKGHGIESARAAGYAGDNAVLSKMGQRILRQHEDLVFAEALQSIGMSKMTLALRLKRIIDDPNADNKEVLAATKLMLTAMGERVESGGANVNVNVAAPKSLVMVGFDQPALKGMLKGKPLKQLENKSGEVILEQGSDSGQDSQAGN